MTNRDSYFCDGAFYVVRLGVFEKIIVTGFLNQLSASFRLVTGFFRLVTGFFRLVTGLKTDNYFQYAFFSRLYTLNYGIIQHHSEYIRASFTDTRVLAVRLW